MVMRVREPAGKPRKKKGETPRFYRLRVADWRRDREHEEIRASLRAVAGPGPVIIPPKPPACQDCTTWIQESTKQGRGECFVYPEWRITNATHYCGKFERKTK